MELRLCPLCGSKPLKTSDDEVFCINHQCPAGGVITSAELWNRRAEVVSRNLLLQKELILEHSMGRNEDRFLSGTD